MGPCTYPSEAEGHMALASWRGKFLLWVPPPRLFLLWITCCACGINKIFLLKSSEIISMIAFLEKWTSSHSAHSEPMWVATVPHQPAGLVPTIFTARPNPKLVCQYLPKPKSFRFGAFGIRLRLNKYKVSAVKKQLPELETQKPGHLFSTLAIHIMIIRIFTVIIIVFGINDIKYCR